MYSYHNRIKQRISQGEMIGFSFADNYKKQGPRLVLHFNTGFIYRPIKMEKIGLYEHLFKIYPEINVPGGVYK